MNTSLNFQIPWLLVFKVKSIAAQADLDVHTVVEIALDRYFSQARGGQETLLSILQRVSDDRILARLAYR